MGTIRKILFFLLLIAAVVVYLSLGAQLGEKTNWLTYLLIVAGIYVIDPKTARSSYVLLGTLILFVVSGYYLLHATMGLELNTAIRNKVLEEVLYNQDKVRRLWYLVIALANAFWLVPIIFTLKRKETGKISLWISFIISLLITLTSIGVLTYDYTVGPLYPQGEQANEAEIEKAILGQ